MKSLLKLLLRSRRSPYDPPARYELHGVLGHGAMGVVHKAQDHHTDREVALKTLVDLGNPEMMSMFRKEYSLQKSLHHPNIVDIYDIGELKDELGTRPFFTMPLLRGANLEQRMRDGARPLEVQQCLRILSEVARGLQAAHEGGLVHRDLKPSNIFILTDGSVKLLDFGVAQYSDHLSTSGGKGTPKYMAPEQYDGAASVRSDISR